MMRRLLYGVIGCLTVAVVLAATPGCRKEEPAAEKSAAEKAEAAKEVEAKLAQADEFDGKSDNIVSKCSSCALKMDGKSEHTLEVSDYKLYFCTEACKTRFAEDTTKAILALEIPEG